MEAFALSLIVWAASISLPLFGARATAAQNTDSGAEIRAMFLNVGKADAALFCLGDKRYLIDTGTKESAAAMLRALRFWNVAKLDGVLITHTDKDHVGGLKALLKSDVTVSRLYAPVYHNAGSAEQHPVAKQAEKAAVAMTWLHAGDVVQVSDTVYFNVLGPLRQDTANENNNSLVLRLVTPQGDMLLTGDMETPEENDLLVARLLQPAAVLKVGHHGDSDASSATFLYTAKPEIAVISTAEADTPGADVIGRLWAIGAEVLLTHKATCCVLVTLQDGNAVGQLIDYPLEDGAIHPTGRARPTTQGG